jgi:hypothetical protein
MKRIIIKTYYFDFHIVDQQNINDTNLANVYEKLILSNSIVMSKSEICQQWLNSVNSESLKNPWNPKKY